MEERLGRYQLVRRLGDNDLCDAYTALQHGDGGFVREVLVKRLKDALVTDQSALRAFQGEAHLLAPDAAPESAPAFETVQTATACSAQAASDHIASRATTKNQLRA